MISCDIYLSLSEFCCHCLLSSHVWLFVTPWTAAHPASLSFTVPRSLLKLMPTEVVMPSNHLILRHPFLLLPEIFPSIRVFSNELALHIRWPKYWSYSISPSNEYSGFGWLIHLIWSSLCFSFKEDQGKLILSLLLSHPLTQTHLHTQTLI